MRASIFLASLGPTFVATPALAAPAPLWTLNKATSKIGFVAAMNGQAIDRRWFGVGQGQFAGTEAVAANVRVNLVIGAWR